WLIAERAISAIRLLPAGTLPRLDDIRLDGLMFAFAVALTLLTGLVIGLVVTFRVVRSTPWVWLRQRGYQPLGMPFTRGRPSSVLVVASITAGVVLLAGAGLLLNSFVRLVRVDPGFDPTRLLTFQIALPANSRYADPAQEQLFFKQFAESMRQLPGAEAA